MYAILYILTGTYLNHSTDHHKSGQPWLFYDDLPWLSSKLDEITDGTSAIWPFIFDNNPEIDFKLAQRNEFEIVNLNKP